MNPNVSTAQIKKSVRNTTIHELGHQFNTPDDHDQNPEEDRRSGIDAEDSAIKAWEEVVFNEGSLAAKQNAVKPLILYRCRLNQGVTIPSHPNDFKKCVGSDDLRDSDSIFCEYHKHIINSYTGW
jgi:hypothetical protein